MGLFKGFNFAADAQQEVDIVVAVEQAGLFIVVDLEFFLDWPLAVIV